MLSIYPYAEVEAKVVLGEMTENLVNPAWPHNKNFFEFAWGQLIPTHPLGDPLLTYVKTFKAVLFCLKADYSLTPSFSLN